jgi:uncharacterized protein
MLKLSSFGRAGLACVVVLATGSPALAVVAYVGGGYAQNFDSLASTPNNTMVTWTDDLTIAGWFSDSVQYRIGTGSSTNADLYSFGALSASDRALGSVAGNSNLNRFALVLRNDTAQVFHSFDLSYTGEQWRQSSSNVQNILEFHWALAPNAGISDPNDFVADPALNFAALHFAAAGNLDGNAAANRTALSGSVVFANGWQPGQELWLRWTDRDDPGFDQGLAIDDLTFSAAAIPEPETGWLAVLVGAGVLVARSGLASALRRRGRAMPNVEC